MTRTTLAHGIIALCFSACGFAWAAPSVTSADPLAAIDLHRSAIIADIARGYEGDRTALTKRLAGLRADRLLSASLASSRNSLETILADAERTSDSATGRASAKVLGSAATDLVYTPLTPCRLIDTRGFGAPIQGGIFAPNERRAYVPNGLCGLPVSGVATILISFTTENLSPNSGGYLAILAPAAPVTASVDVFNLGAEWSASNTAVVTGSAAQFDVLVAVANAHVVIDVLGYFAPATFGNITLAPSTASTGNILKGANAYIHNFGSFNTFMGEFSGNFTLTGTGNTAIGRNSMLNVSSGGNNTALGLNSLANTSTGAVNTGTGQGALAFNTTGSNNTASGQGSLFQNSTGNNNIGIGWHAGFNLTAGDFDIIIGTPGVASESNTIRIGDANQTKAFIAGIRGVTTALAAVPVLVDTNGQLGTVSSSRRAKDDIADMDAASSALMKLRPVTFHYKSDQSRMLQYGLVAEEVAEVYPGLVAHSADGKVETVMYQFLPTMLLNEVQRQQRTIDTQAAEIAALKQAVAEMRESPRK